MRIGEGIHAIVRNNTFENCGAFGVYTYPSGAFVRFEYNIIRNNEAGGLTTGGCDGIDINYDLGGGLVDVWEVDPTGIYGASAAARVAAPSAGQNTFNGNAVADFINEISESPQPAVKAENNFWDHSTVADVLANDVSGAADVDPLGVNPNSP
jgi:hypothetical protein